MTTTATSPGPLQAALIWLDDDHALVARTVDGGTRVTPVDRSLDADGRFLLRVMHEADDCDRLLVTGADDVRVAFEREYVAVYRRPERLIDGGFESEPTARGLADRLRLITPLVAEPG